MDSALAELPFRVAPRVEMLELDEHRRVYLNGHLIAFYRAEDKTTERTIMTQLAEVTTTGNAALARTFGIHEVSLSRFRSKARRLGGEALAPKKRGPKGPSQLTAEVCNQIEGFDAKKMSTRKIAQALAEHGVEISYVAVANALRAMRTQNNAEIAVSGQTPLELTSQPDEAFEVEDEELDSAVLRPNEPTRYAGAMMLLPILERLGLWEVLAGLGAKVRPSRFGLFETVAAVILGFALRFRSIEDFKNGNRRDLGVLLGQARFPGEQTLRMNLDSLSESIDPVELTREMFRHYVRLDPVWEGLYYVDSHFIPYYGMHPVPYGWNSKRKHAEPGHMDTYVHDANGRALFFISQPLNSSLVQSIRTLVGEIRAIHGDAPFTLVFDRGGYSGELFGWLNQEGIGYITYLAGRKARRRYPKNRFVPGWVGIDGERHVYRIYEKKTRMSAAGLVRTILWLDEKDDQLPLLTNNKQARPAFLIHALRMRWRQENGLKYLSENYAIDQIIEYGADPETETHWVDNPRRKKLLRDKRALQAGIEKTHAQIGRNSLAGYMDNAAQLRSELREQHAKLRRLNGGLANASLRVPIESIPGKTTRSLLRDKRRIVVTTLKIVAYNAERILARRFNQQLRDPNEYLSLFRALLRLHGSIQQLSPDICEVVLERPRTHKLREALDHVLLDLNANPGTCRPGGLIIRFRIAMPHPEQR